MISKQESFKKISELVERFNEQAESYKRADYNETQTRRDFIDPFFKALGWDVDNEHGYAESYREVIHEDRVKVEKSNKAPDYSFRLAGGKRLFFVEAKKPSVDVKLDEAPAYQIRRYGWSAKLPVSIITNFAEFVVYDCTKRPKPTDKASASRIKYLSFADYLEEFDFLWDTFSKERVLKGSFDKFVEGKANKKGTATVDKEFLQSLDTWRKYLATSISWNNKHLDEEEINFVVQQTIDRIIFLRIAEDRGVEPDNNLRHCIKSGNYYKNLFEVFKIADEKYNSGLFDFRKDQISKDLNVDNKVIKNVVEELYYPKCEYAFDVMPVEILGTAYEQFLGKVIRITPAHYAKIEEKPEVRKAGGVYYTPQYIVDYIVKTTVGKKVEGKTPEGVGNIKIVDPACGSGSFLLGAYQFLLNWHKDYYHNLAKETTRKKRRYRQEGNPLTPDGNLTTAEKKRILLNNIYGVDIDVNAVEVTKLSLLLKCMEGETSASIAHQLSMFRDRVLPSLDNNIKCGNSLIDTDYYDGQLDFGDVKKVKPFNWEKAFPDVFNRKKAIAKDDLKTMAQKARLHAEKALHYVAALDEELSAVKEPGAKYENLSGFDVVIGNPPYIQMAMFEWFDERQKKYMLQRYCSSMGRMNSYGFFIEFGIRLLNEKGKLGFIVPNTILTQDYYQDLRKLILSKTHIDSIVNYEKLVFVDAVVETVTLVLEKSKSESETKILFCSSNLAYKELSIKQIVFESTHMNRFIVSQNDEDIAVKAKIDANSEVKLQDACEINQAIALKSNRAAYLFDVQIDENYKPVIDGREIGKYQIKWSGKYLKYDKKAIHSCKREDIFLSPEKIFFRRVSSSLIATLDDKQFYALNTLVVINKKQHLKASMKFLLGIFNSKLMNFYYTSFLKSTKKVFSEIQARQIGQLPLPPINFDNPLFAKNHFEIDDLVGRLLKANADIKDLKLPSKIEQMQQYIAHCEGRIDHLVYQLYGLTEDEIKIIEGE